MPTVNANGVEIYYEEYGTGKEIVIFGQHDISKEGGIQQSSIPLFPKEWHVYLPELPGYGRSTKLREFRGIKQWSDDFYVFTSKLGLKNFVYMGLSLLGQVGLQLVLDHPEIFKGFVSMVAIPIPNPPSWPDPNDKNFASSESDLGFPAPTKDKTRLRLREEFLTLKKKSDESLTKEEQDIVHRLSKKFGNESRKELMNHLHEVKVPTLLLFGGMDWSNPVDQVINSAMSIPGAKAVFFQDYAHGLCQEGPEKIIDEITLFIKELNRSKK